MEVRVFSMTPFCCCDDVIGQCEMIRVWEIKMWPLIIDRWTYLRNLSIEPVPYIDGASKAFIKIEMIYNLYMQLLGSKVIAMVITFDCFSCCSRKDELLPAIAGLFSMALYFITSHCQC